ncbi:hypothetical protein ACIQMP_08045 [Streptomyces sp. NPDC091385]|uniref:hypothetical protein n=1 Tax=Streptomyces sp. NPDC091385 TaxID=3365997 RepID=UPI0038190B80
MKDGSPAKPSKTQVQTPVVEECNVEDCGTAVTDRRPHPGMVRVTGSRDGAAAHWYCPVRCAGIARARADLRAVPTRPATRKGGRCA